MKTSGSVILIIWCALIGQIGSGQEDTTQLIADTGQLIDLVEDVFNRCVSVVSSWFEDENMMSCVTCDDQSNPANTNAISALWLGIQDAVLNLPKTLETHSPRKESNRWALYWGWAFLEFSMGAFVCFVMASCIVSLASVHYEWTRMPTEEHFYDAPSSDVTIIEKDVPKFFPNNPDVGLLDELDVKAGPDNYNDARREIVDPKLSDFEEKVDAHPDHTSTTRSTENCVKLAVFKPLRPAPPTVKVYNLHKPQEIPNDIMEALLCLKKNCEHDHAKIRLIGPKVFVYSTNRRGRIAKAKKRMKLAFEFRQPWLPGEVGRVIGEDVLSDDFELDGDTITVSTQTEMADFPANLTIKTEAYIREEDRLGSHKPRSGAVYFSTDNNWDDMQSSDRDFSERYPRMVCSNVRDSVVRSRPEISQIELSLNDFDFDFGLPQATSSFQEDASLCLAQNIERSLHGSVGLSEDPGFDNSLLDRSTSSETALADVTDRDLSTTYELLQKRIRSMLPNKITDLIPYRPTFSSGDTTLLDISRNMTYMGSNTSFYERLSLVLAHCVIKKMRTYSFSNLSWVSSSHPDSHPARSRLNRTV